MQKHESAGTVYYNPKLVSCPTCNAPTGEPCIGLIAPGCGPHLERYYRARAYLTRPSNQPQPKRMQLCECWFCQQTGTHYANPFTGETPLAPRAPRVSACEPGCTLNSNHQGDCND